MLAQNPLFWLVWVLEALSIHAFGNASSSQLSWRASRWKGSGNLTSTGVRSGITEASKPSCRKKKLEILNLEPLFELVNTFSAFSYSPYSYGTNECTLSEGFCALNGTDHANDGLRDVRILWDPLCSGSRTVAMYKMGQTVNTLFYNDCFRWPDPWCE